MRTSRPGWSWFLAIALAGCGVSSTRGNGDGGGAGDLSASFNFDFGAEVCSPSDPPECDGSAIKTCRFDGSGYDFTPCDVGCANGACTCNPGDVRCNGVAVEKCDGNGAWQPVMTCPQGTQCENGACSDARCMDELMGTNPHALPTNAWPRYRHDNRNSGSTPTKMADMPKLKWKVNVGGCNLNAGGMGSGPVVNQNNLIFITGGDLDPHHGSLHSYDAKGNELWFFAAQTGFASSTPAVRADGTSYFSAQSGQLFAIDPKGMQAWVFQTGSQADSDPIVTKDGILVYSSDDGSVYGIDPTGKMLWKTDPGLGPGEVDAGIAESCDGKIYVGGRVGGWCQIDAMTGKVNWKIAATGQSSALFSSPLITADGTMYGVDSGGMVWAIDPTGKVIWQSQVGPNGFSAPGILKVGARLFSIFNDGTVRGLDATNGKQLWASPAINAGDREITSGPIGDGKQRIYVNSNDGFVYAFDVNGNQLWKIAASGASKSMDITGTPAIGNDGTMYVPGNDGFLYAFQ